MEHGARTSDGGPTPVSWASGSVLGVVWSVVTAVSRRVACVLSAAVLVGIGSASTAHWLPPEALIAQIGESANKTRFGITQVTRDPKVGRVLYVRVGPEWEQVQAAERRQAAEEWLHLWRGGVAQGIVAVLDDATGRSLVNFDARGRAQLTGPTAARPSAEATEGR